EALCQADPTVYTSQGRPLPAYAKEVDFARAQQGVGLVRQISEADLADTDLYLYRVSTGALIAERPGLKREELGFRPANLTNRAGITDEDDARFGFQFPAKGPTANRHDIRDSQPVAAKLDLWKSENDWNLDLQGDQLKPGERVRLVAVNRATGYLGTKTVRLKATGDTATGMLGIEAGTLRLQPPNLKVHVRRTRTGPQQALSGDGVHRIGFEGKGLASDRQLRVITEWRGPDGAPLPSSLPGFTGRLSRVVKQQGPFDRLGSAAGSDRVHRFRIRPGQHTQVLKLPASRSPDLAKRHYYLHVDGAPKTGNADFAVARAEAEGPLKYRPKTYVPVKVRVWDPESSGRGEQLAYRWVHRPEMQFSVLNLEIEALKQG
ncbi:MAG: hypothetical protein ABEJ96_01120, partial [Thiohalorhabdaceae bacterium]